VREKESIRIRTMDGEGMRDKKGFLQNGERERREKRERERERWRERDGEKKSGDYWADHNLFEASLLAPDPDREVDKLRILLDEALELKVIHVFLGILPQAQDDAGAGLARDLILAIHLCLGFRF
jgi:hypothetical protein